jgi:hypothetical protein
VIIIIGDRCCFTLVYYIVIAKGIGFYFGLLAKLASFERILPEVPAKGAWPRSSHLGVRPKKISCCILIYPNLSVHTEIFLGYDRILEKDKIGYLCG